MEIQHEGGAYSTADGENRAEGEFVLQQRKADAERYAKEQEAVADRNEWDDNVFAY